MIEILICKIIIVSKIKSPDVYHRDFIRLIKTLTYSGDTQDAMNVLKSAIHFYDELGHSSLIELIGHFHLQLSIHIQNQGGSNEQYISKD